MAEEDKYIDPRQNPFIPQGIDPDNPGAPMSDEERGETDMNSEGLIPVWEKDKLATSLLHGIDDEKLKALLGNADTFYIYDKEFYSDPQKHFMTAEPRLAVKREGDNIKIERPDGSVVITAEEADLLRMVIEREAKKAIGAE